MYKKISLLILGICLSSSLCSFAAEDRLILDSNATKDKHNMDSKFKHRQDKDKPGRHKPIPQEQLYNPEVTIDKSPTDLQFVPDKGVRVDFATLPNAGIDPKTGVVHLYYDPTRNNPNMPRGSMHATSKDGLKFTGGEILRGPVHNNRYPYDSRNTLLPDGNWRRYEIDPRRGYVVSYYSTDGAHFTPEQGICYKLQEADRGWMGVYTVFKNPLGDLVYIYLGDKHGSNNARLAYSENKGKTFKFKKTNVFGDASLGGGPQSFVDPASLILPDGRVRIITMRMCHIYTFISTNQSCTSFAFEGHQLEPPDFTELGVQAFFDPKLVLLPSGKMRIYVSARIEENNGTVKNAIVSATSKVIE